MTWQADGAGNGGTFGSLNEAMWLKSKMRACHFEVRLRAQAGRIIRRVSPAFATKGPWMRDEYAIIVGLTVSGHPDRFNRLQIVVSCVASSFCAVSAIIEAEGIHDVNKQATERGVAPWLGTYRPLRDSLRPGEASGEAAGT